MKKYILTLFVFNYQLAMAAHGTSDPTESLTIHHPSILDAWQIEKISGHDQKYFRMGIPGKDGKIESRFIKEGVRVITPDNVLNFNNHSVYNHKTGDLIDDPKFSITRSDQLPCPPVQDTDQSAPSSPPSIQDTDQSACPPFQDINQPAVPSFDKNRIASIAVGISGFLIADRVFEAFLQKPVQSFACWALNKQSFLKLNQEANRRWGNRISFIIRTGFDAIVFALGYKAMSKVMEK